MKREYKKAEKPFGEHTYGELNRILTKDLARKKVENAELALRAMFDDIGTAIHPHGANSKMLFIFYKELEIRVPWYKKCEHVTINFFSFREEDAGIRWNCKYTMDDLEKKTRRRRLQAEVMMGDRHFVCFNQKVHNWAVFEYQQVKRYIKYYERKLDELKYTTAQTRARLAEYGNIKKDILAKGSRSPHVVREVRRIYDQMG